MKGDLDDDNAVTPLDIPPFTASVLAPEAASADDRCAADTNDDSNVNGLDIQIFVGLLMGA